MIKRMWLLLMLCCGLQANEKQNDNSLLAIDEVIAVKGMSHGQSLISQPNPVLRIDASELKDFGSLNLRDILSELPAITNNGAMAQSANDQTGLNYVDLRHLGAKRTLVLIDGKRQVAGSPDAMQLDLSTIPVGLIEQIEVVTGGAAATYGADGISGVINVHIKDSYQGHELNLLSSASTQGVDSNEHGLTYMFGADIASGRGNFTLYSAYEKTDSVMASDLAQFNQWGIAANNGQFQSTYSLRQASWVRLPHMVNYAMSTTGVVEDITFTEDGTPIPRCEPQIKGADKGYFPQGCKYAYYHEDHTNFIPESDRYLFSTRLNYDITDEIEWSGELKFNQTENKQPSIANLAQINLDGFSNDSVSYYDLAGLSEIAANGAPFISKVLDELGEHYLTNTRKMLQLNSSINGYFYFGDGLAEYELYALFGENRSAQTTHNKIELSRFAAAANPIWDEDTQQFQCNFVNDSLPVEERQDCVVYRAFGYDLATQEAKNWVVEDVIEDKEIKLMALGGYISTDSSAWFSLPYGAIDIYSGFEWRKENYVIEIDDPTTNAIATNRIPKQNQSGQLVTIEGYVDFSVPLYISDDDSQQLQIKSAIRWVDYSHIGLTHSWQVGLSFRASEQWFWRATVEHAVRGPNLVETYSNGAEREIWLSNVCENGSLHRNEQGDISCMSGGSQLRPEFYQVLVNEGGGGGLVAEDSKAKTFGFSWQIPTADSLSLSLDYFEYSIDNAILELDAEQVFDNCYDFRVLGNNQYCDQVNINNELGVVSFIEGGFFNASSMDIAGIDVQLRYEHFGQLFGQALQQDWRLNISQLLALDRYQFLRHPELVNIDVGEVGDPEWQIRLTAHLAFERWSLDWTSSYTHSASIEEVTPGAQSDFAAYPYFVGSIVTHDVVLGFKHYQNTQLNIGINNLFNKVPPGYIDNFNYDLIGRRVFMQLSYSFD